MSEYRDFKRCVICRSLQNLNAYKGKFEVTQLLNSLFYALTFPYEKQKTIGKTAIDKIESELRKYSDSKENLLRHLRNGLSHYHLQIEPNYNADDKDTDREIEKITIWDQRKEDADSIASANCKFTFSVLELKEFTLFAIDTVLDELDSNICKNCKLSEDTKCQV